MLARRGSGHANLNVRVTTQPGAVTVARARAAGRHSHKMLRSACLLLVLVQIQSFWQNTRIPLPFWQNNRVTLSRLHAEQYQCLRIIPVDCIMFLRDVHSRRIPDALSAHSVFPLTPSYQTPDQRSKGVWIRYFYEGGKLTSGDGMLFQVKEFSDSNNVKSDIILSELTHRGVDLSRFVPRFYKISATTVATLR